MAYAAQPQTSRAGLISTIVVLSITTLLSAIFLFISINDKTKVEMEYKAFQTKYADMITPTGLGSPDLDPLKVQAKDKGVKVIDVLTDRGNALATLVNGQNMESPAAEDRGAAALKQFNDELKEWGTKANASVTLGNTNLVDALTRWQPIVQKLLADRDELNKKLTAAEKQHQDDLAATEEKLKQKEQAIADLTKQIDDTKVAIKALQDKHSADLKDLQDQVATTSAAAAALLNDATKAKADKEAALVVVSKQRDNLLQVLRRYKQHPEVKDDMVRSPDGKITLVNNDECYIDLGEGDQISVGMTFEVYDPIRGIPPINDDSGPISPVRHSGVGAAALAGGGAPAGRKGKDDDKYESNLPTGKGSIEVTAVGPGKVAKCRVIHQELGQTVSQGDLIANLVYDKNIKFQFFVFGDFDLSNVSTNGRQNDIATITRLILQWGGKVQPIADPKAPADSVNAETDFIVLGKPPVVPSFTPDELQQPANQADLQKAKDKAALYDAILGKASDLSVPVLNQNRFLYYVGFYDQAKR